MRTHLTSLLACSFLLCLATWARADDTETESGDGKTAADQPVGASDEGKLAMQSFRKPEGWTVSLFAAEPELANPVALTVDNQGRVFVCESFRQDRGVTDNRKHGREWLIADLSAETVQDRIDYHLRLLGSEAAEYTAHDDRIRLLEDIDGDGEADKATMFAEGFNKLEEGTGAGVLVRGNKAYYTCIPKLWALTDEDGDGKADHREALHDGYGVRVAFRGHDSHGLVIGPDGRLYFSIGDRGYNIETADGKLKNVESGAVFRCELDGSGLEIFATGLRNPQELAFDNYGYLFTGDNNSDSGDKARWVNVMQGGDTGWRMMYQYIPDRGPFNREKIWYPYSEDTPAYTVPPIENIGDGPSGLTFYPGTGLSGDFDNCFLMVDFRGGPSNSGIRLIRSQPKGAFWEIERSEELVWNILATDAQFGPDGGLWVCDWVDGWVGEGKGRVYRFADPSGQEQDIVREVQSLLSAGFTDTAAGELGKLLRHVDQRIRLEAQWELATRGELTELDALLNDSAAVTTSRLHGVWGIGQAARLQPALLDTAAELLRPALSDHDLDVRAAAAKVAGELKLMQFAPQIVQLVGDPEPRVQYAACLAAGQMQLLEALGPACAMLVENADADPGLRHAGIMAMTGIAKPETLAELATHESASVRIAAVVAMRKLNSDQVAVFLQDSEPRVQLEAARAIHDVVQIQTALTQLASLELPSAASEALAHRYLNANYRIGGAAAAERIAAFAANADRSQAMRLEAIAMLAAWGEPDVLDRVMNRYQPIASREQQPALEALSKNFAGMLAGSDEIVSSALDAAVQLKLVGTATLLRELALDTNKPADMRAQAINGLVKLDGAQAIDLLERFSADEQVSLRTTALSRLAELAPEKALPGLSDAIGSKEPAEYQAAWDAIGKLELDLGSNLLEQGVRDYIAGSLPPDAWLNVIEAASDRVTQELQTELAEMRAAAGTSDPLAEYRDTAFGGSVAAGKKLFFEKTELSCVRCHKVGETGGEVGPLLTDIGKSKDNRYLLESIVAPDARIAEKFETVVLLTEDDQIVTGILREETPSKIELINAEGEIITVDPVEVVSRKKGKSAMPADLVKSMTKRELRDLVAYLSSLKGE